PWHVAHLAASPVLVVLALISTDLVGIALVMWGWWAWRRDHPALAGSLMGLAFLVRPYPLIFLLALVLVGLREGRGRQAATALVSPPLSALSLFWPALFVLGDAVLQAPRGWFSAAPGYGALPLLPQQFGLGLSARAVTTVALLGWVLAIVLGAWLTFRHVERP